MFLLLCLFFCLRVDGRVLPAADDVAAELLAGVEELVEHINAIPPSRTAAGTTTVSRRCDCCSALALLQLQPLTRCYFCLVLYVCVLQARGQLHSAHAFAATRASAHLVSACCFACCARCAGWLPAASPTSARFGRPPTSLPVRTSSCTACSLAQCSCAHGAHDGCAALVCFLLGSSAGPTTITGGAPPVSDAHIAHTHAARCVAAIGCALARLIAARSMAVAGQQLISLPPYLTQLYYLKTFSHR